MKIASFGGIIACIVFFLKSILTPVPAALLLLFLTGGCAAGDNGGPDADVTTDGDMAGDEGPDPDHDEDGDGITDEHEGRFDEDGPVDTDGDGEPDYLDGDSDNDTIPDSVEAGDVVLLSDPVDSDDDGDPDFRDTDSDGNGIDDATEGAQDFDEDGRPDYADLDNDGDSVSDIEEIGDNPASPDDFDRDGKPDFMDIDSDNDLIADIQEANGDTDEDGTLDRYDMDSDGDTLTDAYEAGDDDYDTWPVDTDDDGYPDFRDVDSDSDGLGDGWEVLEGLDPYNLDSDGDGYDDLTEIGADSDPLDPDSTPATVGNFFFFIDYEQEPVPPDGKIVFKTDIKFADIFFLMDTTGSMEGEIDKLKEDLSSDIIPRIAGVVEDVRYAIGGFDDYPVWPYGGEPPEYNDSVFYILQTMTASIDEIEMGVDDLVTHFGGDCSESQVAALYATATGSGFMPFLEPRLDCDISGGEYGHPCFRPGAIPIVMMVTDAPYHNGPSSYDLYEDLSPRPVTYDEATAALRARHIKVLSIVSAGGCEPDMAVAHATRLAEDTGAVDAEGSPLVFSVSGSGFGLGNEVVSAVQALTGNVPMSVSIVPRDDATDDVNALVFIDRVVPYPAGGVPDPADPEIVCESGLSVLDTDGDTNPDIFVSIIPGTVVCFHMTVNENDFIEPTGDPQVFKAYLDIMGDEVANLDTRKVIFMVPPHIEGPGIPD